MERSEATFSSVGREGAWLVSDACAAPPPEGGGDVAYLYRGDWLECLDFVRLHCASLRHGGPRRYFQLSHAFFDGGIPSCCDEVVDLAYECDGGCFVFPEGIRLTYGEISSRVVSGSGRVAARDGGSGGSPFLRPFERIVEAREARRARKA